MPDAAARAMRKYANLTERFEALGGYAAEAEAASIAHNLSLPDRILDQPLRTLSGGQRRRIELARILFSDAETMILDEPTNHLDADSVVWLREFLKGYKGGLIVISHDVELVGETVNRVFYLDANRQVIDVYNMNWKNYLRQRVADEERRKKERVNVEKKATALQLQAARFGAKASKAAAAHQMVARAEKMLSGLDEVRQEERVAKLRFPKPAPCGKTPLMASGLSKSYGSLEIFTDVDLAIDRGSKVVVLGLNGAGKTTLLRILAGVDKPDTGQLEPGHGLKIGYYAQEHENLDVVALGAREHDVCGARHHRDGCPQGARLVPVHRRRRAQARRRAVGRREDAPVARDARRLVARTCCCSTSRRTTSTPPRARRSSARSRTTRARSCWSRTMRAPSRRSTPSAC